MQHFRQTDPVYGLGLTQMLRISAGGLRGWCVRDGEAGTTVGGTEEG